MRKVPESALAWQRPAASRAASAMKMVRRIGMCFSLMAWHAVARALAAFRTSDDLLDLAFGTGAVIDQDYCSALERAGRRLPLHDRLRRSRSCHREDGKNRDRGAACHEHPVVLPQIGRAHV